MEKKGAEMTAGKKGGCNDEEREYVKNAKGVERGKEKRGGVGEGGRTGRGRGREDGGRMTREHSTRAT